MTHGLMERVAALELEIASMRGSDWHKDALRYRALREKLVYQKSGPNYGWTMDELLPGDDRDAAVDALVRQQWAE